MNPNVWSACPECGSGSTTLDGEAVAEHEPAVCCRDCGAQTYGEAGA